MENTDLSTIRLFYVKATTTKPMISIDFVRETDDGQLVSQIRGLTQAELTQECGREVLMTDLASYTDMAEEAYTTLPTQITEREFIDALNMLPPMRWGRHLGLESFRCSEFYSGNITSIYARQSNGTCWTFRDNAYMTPQAILDKIMEAAAKTATPA
jgi:hypothetical protein